MVRKLWSQLRPATQKRKLAFYRKQGLSDSQVKSRYNKGKLGPQSAARGHARTPERPERAVRNPERYQEYLTRRSGGGGPGPVRGTPPPPSPPAGNLRDMAFENMRRHLSGFRKWDAKKTRLRVAKMSKAELQWTVTADSEELISRARIQETTNKWFYH